MKRLLAIIALLACLLVIHPPLSYGAPTITPAAVDEWAAVAQNTVREGATQDISGNYNTNVSIDVALTSTTAHTGTKIEVQVSSNTSGDEDWTTFHTRTVFGGNTANTEALGGSEAAGQTVLEVASTTGYEADGTKWIFILDDTVADSEMVYQVSHVSNTSVTVQDGTTNAHDASDTLTNEATNFVTVIPGGYLRFRVIVDNTFDSDGSGVHTKTRIVEWTAL